MTKKRKKKQNKQEKHSPQQSKKPVVQVRKEPKILTATAYNTMKWIAIITMVIDHIAFVFSDMLLPETYTAMRAIGRMAFPLFAFLLVECFHFTESKGKHLVKILLIAIISEVPFDMVRYNVMFNWEQQNVCFTLALGFLMLRIANISVDKIAGGISKKEGFRKFFSVMWKVNVYGVCAGIAHFVLKSEFTYIGIILIAFFEIARSRKHRIAWTVWSMIIYVIFITPNFSFAFIALADLIVILMALREKPMPEKCKLYALQFLNKPAFRVVASWFYPVHLMLLVLPVYLIK